LQSHVRCAHENERECDFGVAKVELWEFQQVSSADQATEALRG
jgi:hypothetical protein